MKPYYQDDSVTIYHGDCRDVLPDLRWDVIVTDPPYGISYASNWKGRFQGQSIANDDDTSLRDEILAAWEGPAAVFGSWKAPRPRGVVALLTWDKGEACGMGDLSVPWRPNTEEVYIIGRGWHGRRTSSVIRDASVVNRSEEMGNGNRRVHPNEKPIGLLCAIIAKAPEGIILDPFAGSGSTLHAAKNLGRKAIGVELEERYCAVAAARCSQEVLPLWESWEDDEVGTVIG